MVEFQKNKWKYSTIGLLAILAVGFSFPQAFAHVSNNLAHNVQHILDALAVIDGNVDDVKAKTDNLPSDPADQSDVEDAISGAVTDVGPAKGVKTDVLVNPADGTAAFTTIIGAESGKTFSGRITGSFIGDSANFFQVLCGLPVAEFTLFGPVGPSGLINEEFACTFLSVTVVDPSDSTDDGAVALDFVTQYVTAETS